MICETYLYRQGQYLLRTKIEQVLLNINSNGKESSEFTFNSINNFIIIDCFIANLSKLHIYFSLKTYAIINVTKTNIYRFYY